MEFNIEGLSVIVIAVAVWFAGTFINRQIGFLAKNNIPVAVTGGLLCSIIASILFYTADITVVFDNELRDVLLLAFFSTIGLSARFRLLKEGGMTLVILLIAAAALLLVQNATGVLLAILMNEHPGYGLFGGSVSLAGGHGTAIAWGEVAEAAGLQGAKEVGIAFATFGLIAGGLIGGPIAQRLISSNGHATTTDGDVEEEKRTDDIVAEPSMSATLTTLMLLAICIEAGDMVNEFLFTQGVTLPGFLTAMMVGIVIANASDALNFEIDPVARRSAGEISLQLFLAMSLMSMQLWVLAGAFGKILIVLFVQMTVITLFAVFIIYRVMGRNYDACVIAAGFTGLGMGATPVGIANMNAVTGKYGPSPKAFLVIPLVGAFFLDLMNALIIKTFLALPFMQM